MRLRSILVPFASLCLATAAVAGPFYLASEPGMVTPSAPQIDPPTTEGLARTAPATDEVRSIDVDENGGSGPQLNVEESAAMPVPEPGTLLLLGGGLAAVAIWRRRRPLA